jgi:hypothetical protein
MDEAGPPAAARLRLAAELMEELAAATGLLGEAPPRRYLWTDAFAVCNFLGLHRLTGAGRWLDLALRLIDQVHHTLGRYRADDPRRGWLSGLDEREGERHPTRGGLRIGKELPERGAREPFDPQLEWDRDGQYFHYLTRWVHALHRAAQETGQATFDQWAVELAARAHGAFTYRPAGAAAPRMVWKMSTDLTRALVPSMGHHDPLDALATWLELRVEAPAAALAAAGGLDAESAEAAAMCAGSEWATTDALGIGGLLTDAARLARLERAGAAVPEGLLPRLLADAVASLQAFDRLGHLHHPVERRLAFRELGLAIGLHAVERVRELFERDSARAAAASAILRHRPLADAVERTWSSPAARHLRTWLDHRDINTVMLATSLAPAGYLG